MNKKELKERGTHLLEQIFAELLFKPITHDLEKNIQRCCQDMSAWFEPDAGFTVYVDLDPKLGRFKVSLFRRGKFFLEMAA